MELLKDGFEFALRKRKWMILLALCGFSTYGMYKVYHLPSVSTKRKRFFKLLGALISIAEMVSDSAQTLGVVSKDLKEFLASDADQIPNSLKQLSKIAASYEFSNSLSRVSEAVTLGLIQGYHGAESGREIEQVDNPTFGDRIIDKLTSKARTGFVSVVAGSFARNIVLGFYPSEGINGDQDSDLKIVASKSSGSPQWIDVLSRDKSKLVMADWIKTFVSTVVAIYLDRTKDVSLYDGIFCGLTDPKHQKQVKEVMVYICSGAVETLIKTSYQVLTSPKPSELCC